MGHRLKTVHYLRRSKEALLILYIILQKTSGPFVLEKKVLESLESHYITKEVHFTESSPVSCVKEVTLHEGMALEVRVSMA